MDHYRMRDWPWWMWATGIGGGTVLALLLPDLGLAAVAGLAVVFGLLVSAVFTRYTVSQRQRAADSTEPPENGSR